MNPPVDTPVTGGHFFSLPMHWPGQMDLLTWCQTMSPGMAALLVLAGVIYLLFGYYMFKVLITVNAGIMGGYLGAVIGTKFDAALASAILGAFICAAICWPLMKWAVAVMGGVVGAAIGASIWRSAGLDPAFAWAGAMTGLVGFGMLSFILFRGSIMMYTSLQGAVMLVFGILGLIYKYHQVAPQITNGLTVNALVMPMTILIPAIIGVIFQQANTNGEAEKK
ncbi:MAG: hypothetical protein IT447_10855 [Phycisphaerales bacterium]|nr:hypothetical protein [Phycisphaerales bacterium]